MNLELIRNRLAPYKPRILEEAGANDRAAVAAILRPNGDETEILLIRRAERFGDPWSGHMALPGGHVESNDENLYATVTRETREEIGVNLEIQGEIVGRLDDLEVYAYGKPTGMIIAPYVFILQQEPVYRLNDEVAEMLWGPLGQMARGEINAVKEYALDGVTLRLPAYDVNGRIVWGLTYRILQDFFSKLGPMPLGRGQDRLTSSRKSSK
jgi:8-oxo-dGTP pyrophosphatase MutT (NUDIX family)